MREGRRDMSKLKELEIVLKVIKKTNEIVQETELDNERIAFFRDEVRKNVFFLQEEFEEQYSETVSKFVVFPLLSYVDEKIMFKYENDSASFNWTLLQLEYYHRKDGGEYVFEIIDSLLSDEIYPSICYKTMYFILNEGFLGQYYGNKFDRVFLSYMKKISLVVNKNDYDTSKFYDANNTQRPKKGPNFFKKSALKLCIPLVLFGVSLLYFVY